MIVCNPNNPTSTHIPPTRIGDFLERVPGHVTVILDEAYIEFQTHDDPDATVDLRRDFPNLVVLRTFSKCYGLAGLRVGYALCSARLPRGASTPCASRSASTPSPRRRGPRPSATTTTSPSASSARSSSASRSRRAFAGSGSRRPTRRRTSPGSTSARRDEAEVVAALGGQGIVVRPGTPLGGPGHIRVSYGTREQNQRFLDALAGGLSAERLGNEAFPVRLDEAGAGTLCGDRRPFVLATGAGFAQAEDLGPRRHHTPRRARCW